MANKINSVIRLCLSAQARLVSYPRCSQLKARSQTRLKNPCWSGSCGCSSFAHIIGVSVSEITNDTSIATDKVIANSRN